MEGAVYMVTNSKSLPRVLIFLEGAIGNERQEHVQVSGFTPGKMQSVAKT
jgi:hypothetical protein